MDHQHLAHRKYFFEAVNAFQVKPLQIKLFLHADKEFGCGKQRNAFGIG